VNAKRSRSVLLIKKSCRLALGISKTWRHFQPTAHQKYPEAVDLLTMPLIKDFPESINHYANEGP
jgi:hypothetical protein